MKFRGKFKAKILFLTLILIFAFPISSGLSCGSSCLTASEVAQETTKCLFIYGDVVYEPPFEDAGEYKDSIENNMHKDEHFCGADVTGQMKQSHSNEEEWYLLPFVCAPLCEPVECDDSDGDGYDDSSCGGPDCNDGDASINPGATETCNDIDDNCAGGIDEGCPSVEPGEDPTPNINQNGSCTPLCEPLCGQDNKCGGTCPNTDISIPGKCGNLTCEIDCSEGSCGQSDGCGGFCLAFDKETCGLCGNAPCCVPEICEDIIDNDCDGEIDEGCNFINRLLVKISGIEGEEVSPDAFQARGMSITMEIIQEPGFQARMNGLLAFFFSGLTLLVGIYRLEIMKKFSRSEIIRYHATLGFLSLLFVIFHIVAVLLDSRWSIELRDIFIPSFFSSPTLFNSALGTIGLYLLLITIISGIFFVYLAKKIGYNYWLLIHRSSFIFYILVFFHALRIGTDFGNPYILIFFSHVFLLMAIYAFKKFRIKMSITLAKRKVKAGIPVLGVEQLNDPKLIGKKVITKGNISKVSLSPNKKEWRKIYVEKGSIFAQVPEEIKAGYYSNISGTIKKEEQELYIHVDKADK
jgi:DMSO/TMAO reductase YedYZ heme-binding membrane subunit